MKILAVIALVTGLLSSQVVFAQGTSATPNPTKNEQNAFHPAAATPCANCSASGPAATPRTDNTGLIPGTTERVPVGSIENLIPIGVLTVLGCEKCSAEAVSWALQQGSSFEEVDRTLRMVEAMQNLDCFKQQFGPDVTTRMQKPLASARGALQAAMASASKPSPRQ